RTALGVDHVHVASPVTSAPSSAGITTRQAGPEDAPIVQAVYGLTPGYFQIISTPIPTLEEVRTDLATAVADPRRYLELILLDDPWRPSVVRDGVPAEPIDPQTGLR